MSEELNKQLSDLASKLGVTVEHLWSVLVRQAYIDGISSLTTVISCVLLGVVVLWAFFYLRRKFKPAIEPKEHFILTTEPVQYRVLAIVLAVAKETGRPARVPHALPVRAADYEISTSV